MIPDVRQGRPAGRKLRCKSLGGREASQVGPSRRRAIHQAVMQVNRLSSVIAPHQGLRRQEDPERTGGITGVPSPLLKDEGCNRRGRTGQEHPSGSTESERTAWWKRTAVKGGRARSQPRESRMAKAARITVREVERWVPSLAAEDEVSDDARCNVWKSQSPLGEGGSWVVGCLHQRQASRSQNA